MDSLYVCIDESPQIHHSMHGPAKFFSSLFKNDFTPQEKGNNLRNFGLWGDMVATFNGT